MARTNTHRAEPSEEVDRVVTREDPYVCIKIGASVVIMGPNGFHYFPMLPEQDEILVNELNRLYNLVHKNPQE